MKTKKSKLPRCHFLAILLLALAPAVFTNVAPAADQTKVDNAISLDQGGSWVSGAAPGKSGWAIWNGAYAPSNLTNSLANTVIWGGILVSNVSGAPTIYTKGSGTLALTGVSTPNGLVDVDLSHATVDFTLGTTRVNEYNTTSTHNLIVPAGRTFTFGNITYPYAWNINNLGTTTGAQMVFGGAGNYVFTGQFFDNNPGGGSMNFNGPGMVTLVNPNYVLRWVLNGGTLNLNGGYAINGYANQTLTINGGTIDNTSGGGVTFTYNPPGFIWNGDFTFAGTGSLNLGTGPVMLGGNRQVVCNANLLTVAGPIGDGGSGCSLTKAGAGQLTLSGANTYSGSTFINAGTLALSGGGLLANTAGIVVASNAIFNVSGLSRAFTLAAALGSQTLSNRAPGAIINGTNNCSTGALSLVYDGVHPAFTITNGGMRLSAATTFKINVTSSGLAIGSYLVIANASSGAVGSVAGTAPSTVTLSSAILANPAPTLRIAPAGLFMDVSVPINNGQATVAMTSPANGQTIVGNSSSVTASGTTVGNIPVVAVWLNVNGGSWTNATTANGWTNWSAAIPAPVGADTVQVYAMDTAGNHSVTNTLTFTIIHTSVLTLTTNGGGLAGPPYNGQSLEVGQNYTVVATPQYGWMFTNWTSNLLPASTSASLNFTMASNLALTANFVYTNYPVLAITTPTNGAVWVTNAALVKVAGTASGTVPLSSVWLSLNGGAWTNAMTTNQWKNWSSLLSVAAGSQVLSACAVDTAGYHSLTNTVDFTLIHTSLMTVRTNGNGTVSTNFDNLHLEVGVNYIMQATGRHGWTFLSWTSNLLPSNNNILTNNPYITFTMQSNLVLTVNFVDLAPPTLTLNELAKGQTAVTNEAPLTITGTTTPAADASPITNVWVSFNSNAWQSATSTSPVTSTNQWSRWMAVMTPTPGLQSVRAYAVDAVGNASLTNAFTFTCRQSFALVVRTNQTGTGLGTINPNYNGQPLIAGNTLTMKAQPLPGNAFVSWTSNVLPPTNSQTVTFTMVSNLVLYANFRDTTPPTLTVTSPANGRVVTASLIPLQGTASDNIAVTQVWYAVNSNPWQLAAGTTNWTASVTLAPGTNVIQAYALDTANNSSSTKSVTVVFQTAPASLTNLRALVTPDDGTPPFEVDFGAKVFSQYAWSTNNDNDAGNYAYASADQATGLLQLQSSALPENSGIQTWLLDFTNHYAAFLDYTNTAGQPVTASAVFSAITNVAPATLTGQTLVSVNALSAQITYNFLKNGVVVSTTGPQQQTNTWTLQNYGPCGALLVLASGTQTNWSLFHFETTLAAEYISESTDGTADAGLAGFARTTAAGNAPASPLNGSILLDNSGATLTTLLLNNGAFALSTSDNSLTGAGAYNYTQLSGNEGQFILNYVGTSAGISSTNVIQFYNPNFGVVTNTTGVSGLLLR